MRRWALLTCGDPVLAEDAVQEALVRLCRHISRFDADRPFEPWLRTLVRNCCRDELTRRGRRSEREAPMTGHEPAAPIDPNRQLDLERAASDVLARFGTLTERQRELVELVDVQGRTPSEVADLLGLSGGAVRNQLHTARRRLREALAHRGDIVPLLREA